MKKLAVVAFGGNALLRAGQKGTIDEQEANAYEAGKKLLKLIKKKYNLVLTHGNGPQVGNILLANTAGNKLYNIPEMPLDVCGAYSQGFIGYILEQQLRNVLEFNFKAEKKYSKLSSKNHFLGTDGLENLIGGLISTNVKEGYYQNVINLNEEGRNSEFDTTNPEYQDCDDGQFFIDFTNGKPKIGFTHPFDRDIYDINDEVVGTIPQWQIISAKQYLNLYYSESEIADATSKEDIAFFNKVKRNIRWIENHANLLTQEEFFELYPNLKND